MLYAALDVKVRKIQRAKEAKIAIFNTTLSFDAPSPANPSERPHKSYLATNIDLWATFFVADIWFCPHSNFYGEHRKTYVCNT